MSLERTRDVLTAYWRDHDVRYVAHDAVFTIMPTGKEIRGREAIERHLEHFYHHTFDARAEQRNAVFADGQGVLEAEVVGRHTGEFAGIAPTGHEIRVPLCVTYELEGDEIKRARVYLQTEVLLRQLQAREAAAGAS